jgi:hypothetical protein
MSVWVGFESIVGVDEWSVGCDIALPVDLRNNSSNQGVYTPHSISMKSTTRQREGKLRCRKVPKHALEMLHAV